MNSDIERRLRSGMTSEVVGVPDWAGVELIATKHHRNRVRGLRTALALFAVALGAIAGAPSWTATSEFVPAFGGARTIEDGYRAPALLALALTAVISVFLVVAARRNKPMNRPVGWRRSWPALTLVPVAYPIVQLITLESSWSMVAQAAAIPCFPLLFWLLAERVSERPNRVAGAAVLWSSIGVTTVLGTVALIDEVLARSNRNYLWRLWPNRPQESGLDDLLGPGWTVDAIAGREMIAVVAIALLTAISLRIISTRRPKMAAVVLPVVIYCGLLIYELATPWGFMIDYDFFISDAVLGSVFGDLSYPVGPMDLVSSIALGLAALSMGLLLWSWGGPVLDSAPDNQSLD